MDTYSMIFVTIGNLVSPSSSVNGDPLFDFPDHWEPHFSAQFRLRPTSEGADWPAPQNERSVRSRLLGSQAAKPWCLARATREMWITCRLLRR
jgi:hypothetical protein